MSSVVAIGKGFIIMPNVYADVTGLGTTYQPSAHEAVIIASDDIAIMDSGVVFYRGRESEDKPWKTFMVQGPQVQVTLDEIEFDPFMHDDPTAQVPEPTCDNCKDDSVLILNTMVPPRCPRCGRRGKNCL